MDGQVAMCIGAISRVDVMIWERGIVVSIVRDRVMGGIVVRYGRGLDVTGWVGKGNADEW
jgi:hypothetical protein